MKTKPTLSVVTIVKNEERQIRGFLDALNGFADEIIIVDTGSSDKTVEAIRVLAEERKEIKFYMYASEGAFHYGKAKNFSIKKATKDFIIVIDADERPSKAFKDTIRDYLAEKDPKVVSVERVDEYVRHLTDDVERVIKNHTNIFYDESEAGRVHEHFVHSYATVHFAPPLWHCQRWNHWLQRPQRMLFQLELQIDRTPKTKSFFGHFLRGIWYFFFRFRKHYFGRGLYKDGSVGFKYAFLRSLDAFLIELFVGLKPKGTYWENPKYNKDEHTG